MKPETIDRLRDKTIASKARLLATTEGLEPAAWDWQPRDGRWSIRPTLAHVGSAQWNHLKVAQHLLAGEPTDLLGSELDAWNSSAVTCSFGLGKAAHRLRPGVARSQTLASGGIWPRAGEPS